MNTTVWTQEADARLRDYLASHELVAGIGTEESTCSVAATNLALTEKVTDTIPMCMSEGYRSMDDRRPRRDALGDAQLVGVEVFAADGRWHGP